MNARLERCLAMTVMALVGAFACGDGVDGRDAAARNLVSEPPSSMEAWHGAMLKKNVPHHGCFSAHYPSAVWQESTCVTVPPIPHIRPQDRPRDHLVGNGSDFLATTSTSIGSILGYFQAASGIASEADTSVGSDGFTFQANGNLLQDAATQALCSGSANAAGCRGWQQFIYQNSASGFTGVYIQYWLRFYQADQTHPCPNGWTTYTANGECYRNGPGMGMTAVSAANAIANLRLGGRFSATGVGGPQDFVYLSNPNGQQLAAVSSDTVFDLGGNWTSTEFNVFGYSNGSQANFNQGVNMTVRLNTYQGTDSTNFGSPKCLVGQIGSVTWMPEQQRKTMAISAVAE